MANGILARLIALARPGFALLVTSGIVAGGAARADPVLGQIDNFQGGTPQGWSTGGAAASPSVIAGGGPAGTGDAFLQIISDGAGAGGRLTVFNQAQWTGNFLLPGVNRIEMDLKNLMGPANLEIRLGLKSDTGPGPPGYSSTTPFVVPRDGNWHHAVFTLDEASLTRINSATLTLPALLGAVAELRVLHSTTPSVTGDFVAATLGIDNILAASIAIPEPRAITLLGLGCACALLLQRRSRRSMSL